MGSDFDGKNAARDLAHLRNGVYHGTAVASIAAGRQTGPHERHFCGGVAPDARLIVVRYDTGGASIGFSNGHIEALGFIGDRAAELGLPVVVNISNGENSGAHDGTSTVEQSCAEFVRTPDRVIVKSAGNEQGEKRHALFTVTGPDTKVLR